ncbi:YgaP-like transmembrane domain, partial [Halorubrum pallidum]
MNQNVGSTDKRVRISLGAVLGAVSLATLANATPLPGVAALVFGVAA